MPLNSFSSTGVKKSENVKLDKSVFNQTFSKNDLIKQVYTAYLANGRSNLAITKTRGLIRGGGRKPWRQKGSGRARFGSSRNPIWRGGGVVFGPTGQENYSHKLSPKIKRQALRQSLSLALKDNRLSVIDSLKLSGKTNELNNLLNKIGAYKRTYLVVETITPELKKAAANLVQLKISEWRYLNAFDVLNADITLFTFEALNLINDKLKVKKAGQNG